MRPLYRNILFISLGMVLAVLLVALIVVSRHTMDDELCKGVKITLVTDSVGVLTVNDVETFMKYHATCYTEQLVRNIDLAQLEEQIVKMPLVASVECYIDKENFIRVVVSEMIPVMHVLGGNHDYCVDINAHQVPTPSKLREGVVLVDGRNVSLQFATGDLFSLILYMQQNGWTAEFTRFSVEAGNKVTMKSGKYGYDVCLGVPDGYVRKLDKLVRFRRNVSDHAKYKTINLDYYGQVVCK